MARAKKDSKTGLKWKKKKWYTLIAPSFFNEREIGQTLAAEDEELIGRKSNVNLMELTGDMKKQNTTLQLSIVKVNGLKASTESIGFVMVPSSIKRVVRRNRDRIDDSFTCATADKRIVRVKPLIVTRDTTSNSVNSHIRKDMRDWLVRAISKLKLEQLMADLVTYRLQRSLRDSLRKIYPLKSVEMRVLKEEPNAKKILQPTKEPKPAPKEEEIPESAEA